MNWYLHVIRNYTNFKGRARRTEFWMFILFNFIFTVAASFVDNVIGTGTLESGGIISGLYFLFVLIPSLAVSVRRLHDTGRTGWFILLWFIPVVGWIILLYFYVTPGHAGGNKYGNDPKGYAAP